MGVLVTLRLSEEPEVSDFERAFVDCAAHARGAGMSDAWRSKCEFNLHYDALSAAPSTPTAPRR
jgi:hypothetical protein